MRAVILAVLLCLYGVQSASDFIKATGENLQFSHQNVFDWMKVLTNQELYALISQKEVQWPTYDIIPPPSFACSDKQFPGFYADPATQCQTFHRCDLNGNLTSYICVNRTVFNPITLICDQWFNVDCQASIKDEYFANRRLYTNLPLFGDSAAPAADISGQWVYVNQGAKPGVKGPIRAPIKPAASAGPSALPIVRGTREEVSAATLNSSSDAPSTSAVADHTSSHLGDFALQPILGSSVLLPNTHHVKFPHTPVTALTVTESTELSSDATSLSSTVLENTEMSSSGAPTNESWGLPADSTLIGNDTWSGSGEGSALANSSTSTEAAKIAVEAVEPAINSSGINGSQKEGLTEQPQSNLSSNLAGVGADNLSARFPADAVNVLPSAEAVTNISQSAAGALNASSDSLAITAPEVPSNVNAADVADAASGRDAREEAAGTTAASSTTSPALSAAAANNTSAEPVLIPLDVLSIESAILPTPDEPAHQPVDISVGNATTHASEADSKVVHGLNVSNSTESNGTLSINSPSSAPLIAGTIPVLILQDETTTHWSAPSSDTSAGAEAGAAANTSSTNAPLLNLTDGRSHNSTELDPAQKTTPAV